MDLQQLLRAIDLSERAAAMESDNAIRTVYLSRSVNNLTRLFQHTKDDHILDLAIERAREAFATFSGDPDMRWKKIQNIAFLLETKIGLAIERRQLSQAVALAEEAVNEIPNDHQSHTRLLSILSRQLQRRYEAEKQEQDLVKAIERGEEANLAAQRTMASNPGDRSAVADTLRQALEHRYVRYRSSLDLERLLSMVDAISMNGVPEQAGKNCLLAQYLAWRYSDQGGSVTDLNRAIELGMSFLEMPQGDPDRVAGMDALIYYFCMKYEYDDQASGLDEVTAIIQAEMDRIKPGEPPPRLHNLTLLRMRRYENSGIMSDLNEAIDGYEEALDAVDDEDELRPALLSNSGYCLCMRYERRGESDILEEAIKRCRTAVDATHQDNPQRIRRMTNLAICLAQKYVRTERLRDLRPAIELGRSIIKAMPEEYPDRFKALNNLGVWIGWSYMQTMDPLELDECITRIREAAELAPRKHVVRNDCLNNLCGFLKMRHKLRHDRGEFESSVDLEDAIMYGREAAAHLPSHHPKKTMTLRNLFEALKARYEENTSDYTVRDEALAALKEAIKAEGSPPSHRLNFVFDDAIPWLEGHQSWQALHQITASATELLGRVSPRSLRQVDQQAVLRRYAGLASTAAAAALQAGKSEEHALGLLEHGRGTITSTLLQNRRDISSLQRKHPKWARKFEQLRDELDPPVPIAPGALSNPRWAPLAASISSSPKDRYRAAEELNELLEQIHGDEAFKTFLLPPTTEELMSAAQPNETVVVINVANFRSDAFLIRSNEINVVDLPDLTRQRVESEAKRFRSGKSRQVAFKVLEWLWDAAVERILARIGADEVRVGCSYAEWPRVYWVPTGPLRLLPIHAAGYHREVSGRSVMDTVVSSYGLSVEEILYGREISAKFRRARRTAQLAPQSSPNYQDAECKFVLVSMESTPGCERLPHATREVRSVCEMLPPCLPREFLDDPPRDRLLRAMADCTIFHFAGHGMTDPRDPSLSGLLLSTDDGSRALPLTVRDLQTLRFHETGPLLAYLSACSTARIDDDQLLDEGIHLMGACRLAGFRHVIGSLWEVSDRLCVDVATTVYEVILAAYLNEASVAQGLHHAIRMLRADLGDVGGWEQRNAKSLVRRSDEGPPLWAAFIHMGV